MCIRLHQDPARVTVLHAHSPTRAQPHASDCWSVCVCMDIQYTYCICVCVCLYIHAGSCVMLRLQLSSGCLLSASVCRPVFWPLNHWWGCNWSGLAPPTITSQPPHPQGRAGENRSSLGDTNAQYARETKSQSFLFSLLQLIFLHLILIQLWKKELV